METEGARAIKLNARGVEGVLKVHSIPKSVSPQLTVAGQVAPEPAHVFGDPVQLEPHDELTKRQNSGCGNLVSSPDRKSQAMTFVVVVGFQNELSGRTIRNRVHGVRTFPDVRRWKTKVMGAKGL